MARRNGVLRTHSINLAFTYFCTDFLPKPSPSHNSKTSIIKMKLFLESAVSIRRNRSSPDLPLYHPKSFAGNLSNLKHFSRRSRVHVIASSAFPFSDHSFHIQRYVKEFKKLIRRKPALKRGRSFAKLAIQNLKKNEVPAWDGLNHCLVQNESGPFLLRKSKIVVTACFPIFYGVQSQPCRQEITFINSLTLFDLFFITTNTIW